MYEYNFIAVMALAISLVCSLAYVGYFQLRAVTRLRSISKAVATGALVVAAWAGGVSWLYCGALALAALGDFLKSFRNDRLLGVAIAVSAGMQVLTCIWFTQVLWIGIEAPLVGILGVFGIAGGFFALVWPSFTVRSTLMVPYFICSLALFSLGLGAASGRPLLMLGLTLYLLSLLLLGFELFLFHGRYRFLRVVGPLIWVFYYCGLVLMMIGGAQ